MVEETENGKYFVKRQNGKAQGEDQLDLRLRL
jgi:hypothetical protein